MRKPLIAGLAGVLVLSIVSLAYAQAQQNTYSVTASVSPTKAGSKSKPVPVGLKFNYTVGETTGLRPAVITGYSIFFGGLRTNGKDFPKCPAAKINAANSDSGCPRGSKVGAGNVENQTGSTADVSDKTLACHLDLTLYNGGQGRLALFLFGAPPTCPTAVSVAIDGRLVRRAGGEALRFQVPDNLQHPIPGFDNAVVQVASSVSKKVSKGTGYFEAVGGCKGGGRPISVTFIPAVGSPEATTTQAKCSA